ncbi:MAG: signal recognition particle protein [Myxococcales bacterium]|nr:signal recognition particle protein [Myxococcales bacterium]USN50494.1 MAG: signal recognition particle protein [Myxococcales bacterium]
MLETISKGFSAAKNLLKKESVLNENNIASALKEVRLSLLEADVEYGVVKTFISRVKERSLGATIKTSITDKKGRTHKLSPSEHFIGICYEELEALMGPECEEVEFFKPITSFMMVGLQGSGKTTTSAKLARYLKEDKNKKPLLVAADIYRPGAAHQLEILGERLKIPVFHIENASAQEICKQGFQKAKELKCDVVIFDTAGRLAIDEKLMAELDDIKDMINPQHIFLVVDAMIGQDAVTTASQFNNRLDISGFILTKLDGDARGGAAISIKEITKKPIKFLGMGEDLNSLEPFRPQGLASRILGMGDVVSLVKDFEKHVDEKEAEADVKRLMRGSFSFNDFIKQLKMIRKLGSFQSILERLPGMQDMLGGQAKVDEREFNKFEAMISSMTEQERNFPELLAKVKRRRERVAKGSGHKLSELEALIERFMMMRQMMQSLGKNPNAMAQMPMFKNMNRMSQIAQNYGQPAGSNPLDMFGPNMMGGQARPPAPQFVAPKVSSKQKKDKRKQQKQARKKNKKR